MFKVYCRKTLPSIQNMQIYCLSCKKHTNNIRSKIVIMTNKLIKEKSRCANCRVDKSRFLISKHNKKVVGLI